MNEYGKNHDKYCVLDKKMLKHNNNNNHNNNKNKNKNKKSKHNDPCQSRESNKGPLAPQSDA